MTSLPGNVSVCGVKGHFAYARLVPGDADGVMDLVPVEGLIVTLTPSPTYLLDATATPPTVIVPEPLVLTTDSNGDLRDVDGNSTAYVIASDDPDLNPHDWTYNVAFSGVGSTAFRAYAVAFPSGQTVDLSLVTPIPAALGVSVSVAQAAEAAAAAYAASAASDAATAAAGAATVTTYAAPKTALYLPAPTGSNQTTAIQAVIDTVPAGGCLVIGDRYRVDGQLNVTTAMTIHLTARGELYSGAGTSAQTIINVTSSNVHIRGEGRITGPQFAAAANQLLVKMIGTSGSVPLTNVSVRGVTISQSGKYGVFAQYIKGFVFEGCTVKDVCYGAFMILCGVNGSICNNVVQNVTMTGYSNAYGIATTRNEVDVTADEPRSANIVICGNRVIDIPGWDGINTHAGIGHTISNNVLVNVLKPIEMVACQGTGGAEKYAPLDMTVTGNVIISTVTNGTRGAAITLVGADGVGIGGGVGSPAEYATGTITGNIIRGHGTESSGISAAILLYYTKGAVISGNTVIEPSPVGIGLYHTNIGFVCNGNTILDPWTTAGSTAVAISCTSSYNVGQVDGNILQLNGKSATIVAQRGISISNQSTSAVTLGANDMAAATTPVNDTGGRGTSVLPNLGTWVPADNLLIACDGDPMLAVGSLLLPTAGVVYVRKMRMAETKAITNVQTVVTGAGSGLSNAYAAVFDVTGATQLGVTADQSTALQSTGTKTMALSSPTAVQKAGTWVYVAVVIGAWSTAPTFAAFSSGRISLNLSTSNLRWGSVGSGLTAMPSSITLGSIGAVTSAVPLWALS